MGLWCFFLIKNSILKFVGFLLVFKGNPLVINNSETSKELHNPYTIREYYNCG
jgi:uncharacterized membrane protein